MPEFIEIEDGIARLITKTVSRQIPLAELVKYVEHIPDVTLPSIARTQVFAHQSYSVSDTKMLILCELPPGVRSITKNIRRGTPRGLRRYRLSIPWTYFWFYASSNDLPTSEIRNWSIYSTRIFSAKEQYKDINSPMIVAPLPNLSADGEVCWGSTSVPLRQSLADQLDQKVNEWYLSDFNDDLDGNVRLPYGETSLKRWVTESRESANSWRNWPEWEDARRQVTVKSLLEHAGVETPFAEKFISDGFIPPANMPLTYGAWDEWWALVNSAQRLRALRSLENLIQDMPDFAPEEIFEEDSIADNDDGGVAV